MSSKNSPAAEPALADASREGTGLSRRRLFGALPVVAAAGVGAAILSDALTATPASAHVGDPVILGADNDGDSATTTIGSENDEVLKVVGPRLGLQTVISGAYISMLDPLHGGGSFAFESDHPSGGGPTGTSTARLTINDGPGLLTVTGRMYGDPLGLTGATAISATARGAAVITARGTSGSLNSATGPTEVRSTGVEAYADGHGIGVLAGSQSGSAIVAANADPATTSDAAVFETLGQGRAVLGTTTNPKNRYATVTGVHNGLGAGIWGTQNNPVATSAAVIGQAQALGRGGQFGGGAAAVRMMPGTAATHPPTGLLGDF
jgi:hypothetical protein